MAYGKLKADSIIYDNSGVDVETTIESLSQAASTISPSFTGVPTAPTPAAGTDSTQIATTAFVLQNSGYNVIDGGDFNSGSSTVGASQATYDGGVFS